jgi:AraC-like DNA-binding protein
MGMATTVRSARPPVLNVLAAYHRLMTTEQVRMWRPADEDRVLLMAGQTTRYAIEPRGEYVFGVIAGQTMRSRRGRERRLVRPGELVAWDPSHAHAGAATGSRPWSARLMVVEVGDLSVLASDDETTLLADIAFPEPVLADPQLAREFVRLHVAVAGVGKFRLIRLFRAHTGLPPHALQVAHRVRTARRLLEAGETIAATAAAAGFADQSHLHRHFHRSLGLTPGEYQRRLRA